MRFLVLIEDTKNYHKLLEEQMRAVRELGQVRDKIKDRVFCGGLKSSKQIR